MMMMMMRHREVTGSPGPSESVPVSALGPGPGGRSLALLPVASVLVSRSDYDRVSSGPGGKPPMTRRLGWAAAVGRSAHLSSRAFYKYLIALTKNAPHTDQVAREAGWPPHGLRRFDD